MKPSEKEQKIESFLLMSEFVRLLIAEYRQNPTGECFVVIDALVTELRDWMTFMKKHEDDLSSGIIFHD